MHAAAISRAYKYGPNCVTWQPGCFEQAPSRRPQILQEYYSCSQDGDPLLHLHRIPVIIAAVATGRLA